MLCLFPCSFGPLNNFHVIKPNNPNFFNQKKQENPITILSKMMNKRDRDEYQDDDNNPQIGTSRNISSDTNTQDQNNPRNKVQDRFLPIANVGRIMKKVIPGNGKISKDAKETVQECVSEFISFVTGEASDKCQREKRKTINGDDILWAITTLGFEDYVNPLKVYLAKYRDVEGEKLNVPKQQQRSMQNDHATSNNIAYNSLSLYPSSNLLSHPQPPFVTTHALPFSQNSVQTPSLPQHDLHEHLDDHW